VYYCTLWGVWIMGVEIQPVDVDIYATRKVWQYSTINLDQLLECGNNMEDYFEFEAEWDDEDVESTEYKIEVNGVVTQDFHAKRMNELSSRVENLEKKIVEMMKKDGEEE